MSRALLSLHNLYATGTTGQRISDGTGLKINLLKSGPFGGDMEIGALIANEQLDYLIFFGILCRHFLMTLMSKHFEGLLSCTICRLLVTKRQQT